MVKAPILDISRLRINTDGQGVCTLVGFYGCPLKCKFCINQQCHDSPRDYMTAGELYNAIAIDHIYFNSTHGGVTFGGGEPLMYSDFIREFSKLNIHNWKIRVETSLNVPTPELIKLIKLVDVFYVDIKDINSQIYKLYTTVDNEYVLENLKYICNNALQGKFVIRLPLISGYNTTEKVLESRKFLINLGFDKFDSFEYITKCVEGDDNAPIRL